MNTNNPSTHLPSFTLPSSTTPVVDPPLPDFLLSFPLTSFLSPASPVSNLMISPIPPFRTPSPIVNTTLHNNNNNNNNSNSISSLTPYSTPSTLFLHPHLAPTWFPKDEVTPPGSAGDVSPSPSPPAPPPSPSPSPASSNNSNSVFHDGFNLCDLSPGLSSSYPVVASGSAGMEQAVQLRQSTFPPSANPQGQSEDRSHVEITLSNLSIEASLERTLLGTHSCQMPERRAVRQGAPILSTVVSSPSVMLDDISAGSKRKRDSNSAVENVISSQVIVPVEDQSPERKKLKDKVPVSASASSSQLAHSTTQAPLTSSSCLPPKPVRNFRRKSVQSNKAERFEFRPSQSAAASSRLTPLLANTSYFRGRKSFGHTDLFDNALESKEESASASIHMSLNQLLRQSPRLATVKAAAAAASLPAHQQTTRSEPVTTASNATIMSFSNETVACGPVIIPTHPSISSQSVGAAAAAANQATSNAILSQFTSSSSSSFTSSHCRPRMVYRLEGGIGSSQFEYGGLPILWRKASKKKPQHALVPTYIYLNRSIPSSKAPMQFNASMSGLSVKGVWPQSISIFVDSNEVVVPKSKEMNVKNPHLGNYVLSDSEQHELFECVQRANDKRKPDVVLHGVKLHRMELKIGTQTIPFYYCSQKRITIEKAFATVTLRTNSASAATTSASNDCTCDGKCVIQAVEGLQQQLLKFISLPAALGSSSAAGDPISRSLEAYLAIGAQMDQMKRIFNQHRKSLLRLPASMPSSSSSSTRSAKKAKKQKTQARSSKVKKTTRKQKRRDPDDKYCQSSEEEEKEDDYEEEEEDDESKEEEEEPSILASEDEEGDE